MIDEEVARIDSNTSQRRLVGPNGAGSIVRGAFETGVTSVIRYMLSLEGDVKYAWMGGTLLGVEGSPVS